MKVRGEQGFTLVEVMVVAAIIAVLAGILVPMIFKEVDEAKIARANADCKSIATALQVFRKDTGKWPTTDPSNNNTVAASVLNTKGVVPTDGGNAQPWDMSTPVGMDMLLRSTPNTGLVPDYPNWKGPYMTTFDADPWGNAYVINANGFANGGKVWVMSAGKDGVINTSLDMDSLGNDDIGIRVQ